MEHHDILAQALMQPTPSIAYAIGQQLVAVFPDKAIVESGSHFFNLQEFAADGHCRVHFKNGFHTQLNVEWNGPGLGLSTAWENGWAEVEWNRHKLEVITASWSDGFQPHRRHWIIADERATAERFLNDVCEWCHEVRGQVLVFSGGCWDKNADLFNSIRTASFDNLILRGELKDIIQKDFQRFLAAARPTRSMECPGSEAFCFLGRPATARRIASRRW